MARRQAAARKQQLEARCAGRVEPAAPELDAVEVLVARARRERARGDLRRATVLLREAANLDEWRARTWALLGARLAEAGRLDEAAEILRRARWLRVREGAAGRAAAIARLAARLAIAA